MSSARGFTLIELLVVIAIMAVLGAFTIANFHSFGEDKELENVALDIVSQIKTAQTNASTGVKCENLTAIYGWRNDIYHQSDGYKVRLSCINDDTYTPRSTKYLILSAGIIIENITVDGSSNALPNYFSESPWGGSFAAAVFEPPLTKLTFRCFINYSSEGCSGGMSDGKLVVRLKNTKTNSTKEVIIEKGGRVYVE